MIEIDDARRDAMASSPDEGPVVIGRHVNQGYGLEVLYVGDGDAALVAEPGRAHWRSAALVETVLQRTTPVIP